jgi:hypothetical protein
VAGGGLDVRQGRRWSALSGSTQWALRTQVRAARSGGGLTLEDGTQLALAPRAVLELTGTSPTRVHLRSGAVYCVVTRGARLRPGHSSALRLVVATDDVEARVTGTELAVERAGGATRVAVTAGVVECVNAHGAVRVRAGEEMRARRRRAPGKARPSDGDRDFAWRRGWRPPERPVFLYDFEQRERAPFDQGSVVAGPPRGRNRACLQTSDYTLPESVAVHLPIPSKLQTRAGKRTLRVRYFVERATKIALQFKDAHYGNNCKRFVDNPAQGAWDRLELPLSGFFVYSDRMKRLADKPIAGGHRLRFLQIRFLGTGGKHAFVDDVELVEHP